MRTSFYTATTLDGFIADENDSLAWLFKQEQREGDAALAYDSFIADIGAMAMGWTTYAWLVDHLASTGEKWPYEMPSWVITHRDFDPLADSIRTASGDVRPIHAAMTEAAAGKDLWIVGGGDLVGQFADAGLLDQVIVQIAPVTLGAGRPLLPRRLDLKLVEFEQNAAFIAARYDVVGPLAP